MVDFVLTSDIVLLVRGPLEVNTVREASILGKDISDSKIFLDEYRVWPIETRSSCKVLLSIPQKKANRVKDIWVSGRQNMGTKIWEEVVHTIFHGEVTLPNSIMIVGPTDSGKSSLSTYIMNQAIRTGLRPAVIDADIGQGDLAPPGVIGCGIVEKQILDLKEVSAKYFAFVGDINPTGYDKLISRSVKGLRNKIAMGKENLSKIDLVVINTDGYITGSGLLGKIAIANNVRPDVIICLGEGTPDLCMLIKDGIQSKFVPSLLCARSPISTDPIIKLRKDRVRRRLNRFRNYLSEFGKYGQTRSIHLRKIKVVYKGVMYYKIVSHSNDYLLLVNRYGAKKLSLASLIDMFVGLGKDYDIVGFGVLSYVTDRRVEIRTNVSFFDTIHLSKIGIRTSTWSPYIIRSGNKERDIFAFEQNNQPSTKSL
jgi:polynucleotide 5'-hydroxyl-kinase GRC3/NOL9